MHSIHEHCVAQLANTPQLRHRAPGPDTGRPVSEMGWTAVRAKAFVMLCHPALLRGLDRPLHAIKRRSC